MPTVGSLFSGIGGLDLGLEWAGFETRWQVEWDPFCQRVLERHWPGLPRYGDITAVDWSSVEPVDLIGGGFPCQPVSIAGKQRAQADERWLWPEFASAIRHLRPRLVLVENVRNLLAVNGGRAFGEVVGDLAALGYDTEWSILSASDVGAPHRRERVWIVGTKQREPLADAGRGWRSDDGLRAGRDEPRFGGPPVADAGSQRPGRIAVAAARDDADRPDAGRTQEAGGPPRDGAPSRTGHVADADGSRLGSDERDLPAGQPDSAGRGALADARGRDGGPGRQRGPGHGRQGLPERGPYVASPDPGEVSDGQRDGLEGLEQGGSAPGSAHGSGDGRDPRWWTAEPDVGRVAHGVPNRVDRLRSLGNAVVPQVAQVIGERLMAFLEESE